MERLNKINYFFLIFLVLAGCGVKGRPLPPLNPAPLGRGEPALKKVQQKKSSIKTSESDKLENNKESSVEEGE